MSVERQLTNKRILITGGAGFIGSNLIERFLTQGNQIVCLDNLLTGHYKNMEGFQGNPHFTFIEGDIRDLAICRKAVDGVDLVLHQAALGSVPRSINDPLTTNEININGFLNMLVASRDANVKRFVFAASSSTYGDNYTLPKVEENIGKPLSPYAITKYVNELYADVFSKIYGLETIGLRYFNVFGRRQDPNGAYAAVIPKFVKQMINHESPVINGDGSYSRDFTYIDNVIHANEMAATVQDPSALNQVFNIAFGENTSLNELFETLKLELSQFDAKIFSVQALYAQNREGDIPHSLASIEKAKSRLNYHPTFDVKSGLKEAVQWYYQHLK
ncbi:MAG TPA: LPS biosynthesis protein WbpP [Marinilabiliales bacterium]|jgi:UDP-N-acetylglucosamine 4-epimerase|nr:MAG: Vi polysaccharide biosynthesis protein VipB/TviC [Bacteroidetes bacterium GWA2_40_14]OFX60205.1 MAG: Vi polysaccharide biosynthesis protein VipB/TviC [Bacteroidetes bacterium GWC2_40_13]OFX75041.1 MAG: Vi polysaccharide biosynthesis protein VipB/TviC [Bacteroidetes bacterium GWD2_40_43]OFX89623.1 MAG: Vi polysaccharide biosynthesis protein VipB/TviC [Bacteroidetes bacterium GWE2_40_63]OFY24142.1 MAG: Vi polysaccharide biosynthesis protein VipB/TviC [Bacteroidetes bacterium GWF2_40_13]O